MQHHMRSVIRRVAEEVRSDRQLSTSGSTQVAKKLVRLGAVQSMIRGAFGAGDNALSPMVQHFQVGGEIQIQYSTLVSYVCLYLQLLEFSRVCSGFSCL